MKTKLICGLAFTFLWFLASSCTEKEPKILTVYYSHWGGTKILAEMIHETVGGDLFVIEPVTPYPAEGTHAAAQKHIEEGFLPPLKGKVENLKSYDIIFIGTPNWFNTMALPVKTFLQENDLSGKTVIPFATYGGSVGDALTDITKMCPNSTALTGFSVSGDDAKGAKEDVQKRMQEWLSAFEFKKK